MFISYLLVLIAENLTLFHTMSSKKATICRAVNISPKNIEYVFLA